MSHRFTGERTLMLKDQIINTSTGSHVFGISPDGKYFLYWKDLEFQAYDLDAGASTTLAAGSPVSFVDTEFDHPGPKPAFGVEGCTSDGKGVIAPDLIFNTAFLVSFISEVMTLLPGDVIMTGTPNGVSPMKPGDTIEVEVEGFPPVVGRGSSKRAAEQDAAGALLAAIASADER